MAIMIQRLLVFARRDRKRLAPVGLAWHKLHPVSIAALLVVIDFAYSISHHIAPGRATGTHRQRICFR